MQKILIFSFLLSACALHAMDSADQSRASAQRADVLSVLQRSIAQVDASLFAGNIGTIQRNASLQDLESAHNQACARSSSLRVQKSLFNFVLISSLLNGADHENSQEERSLGIAIGKLAHNLELQPAKLTESEIIAQSLLGLHNSKGNQTRPSLESVKQAIKEGNAAGFLCHFQALKEDGSKSQVTQIATDLADHYKACQFAARVLPEFVNFMRATGMASLIAGISINDKPLIKAGTDTLSFFTPLATAMDMLDLKPAKLVHYQVMHETMQQFSSDR